MSYQPFNDNPQQYGGPPPPGYNAQQHPPQQPPQYGQPQYGQPQYTQQPQRPMQPQQPTIVMDMSQCSRGGYHDVTEDFTCCGVCLAVCFFPLGLICCFAMRDRHCIKCRMPM